jgi:hypothetical protein
LPPLSFAESERPDPEQLASTLPKQTSVPNERDETRGDATMFQQWRAESIPVIRPP